VQAASNSWQNRTRLAVVEALAVDLRRDEPREQVARRPRAAFAHEPAEVVGIGGAKRRGRLGGAGARDRVAERDDRLAPPRELAPVGDRKPEQLRDHHERQRRRVVGDKVELPACDRRIEQLARQLSDARLERRDRTRRERLADDRAQLGVARRVHEQQPREVVAVQRRHVGAERLVIGKHALHRRVAQHDP
jgi:hypothetical protein